MCCVVVLVMFAVVLLNEGLCWIDGGREHIENPGGTHNAQLKSDILSMPQQQIS